MSTEIYYNKYLKYKNKYIVLQNIINNQNAGFLTKAYEEQAKVTVKADNPLLFNKITGNKVYFKMSNSKPLSYHQQQDHNKYSGEHKPSDIIDKYLFQFYLTDEINSSSEFINGLLINSTDQNFVYFIFHLDDYYLIFKFNKKQFEQRLDSQKININSIIYYSKDHITNPNQFIIKMIKDTHNYQHKFEYTGSHDLTINASGENASYDKSFPSYMFNYMFSNNNGNNSNNSHMKTIIIKKQLVDNHVKNFAQFEKLLTEFILYQDRLENARIAEVIANRDK